MRASSDDQATSEPKRRAYLGRSKQACRPCRLRHTKCDFTLPSCSACSKTGLRCDRIQQSSTKTVETCTVGSLPTSHPDKTRLERKAFHNFTFQVAPFLSSIQNSKFWSDALLPFAERQNAIYDAALAVEALYTMPKNETRLAETTAVSVGTRLKYRNGIDWYSRSVKTSLQQGNAEQTLEQIMLLLLTSIAYTHVELRLGHESNVNGLTIAAFAIVHSAQKLLWNCADTAVLSAVSLLVSFPIALSINSTIIPKQHRVFAMILALKLCADLNAPEALRLRTELFTILYDINDAISGLDAENLDLDGRMAIWYQSFHKLDTDKSHNLDPSLNVLACLYMMGQIMWHVQQHGIHWNREMLERRLQYILKIQEDQAQRLANAGEAVTSGALDSLIIPNGLWVIWYWREHRVLERINTILDVIPGHEGYKVLFRTYMESLITVGYDSPTSMELELFGEKPRVLKIWQLQLCANHLAQRARLQETF